MKNMLALTALAALAMPAAATAQALPAAVIAVVDLQKVTSDCTACKSAKAALDSQLAGFKSRQQALAGPINTEGQAIQKEIDALGGKEPPAALQTRISAFQKKQQDAATELSGREQQIQRNQAYISQQIGQKLGPIYQQVMQRHSATVLLEQGNTLAASASIDVTAEVTAALNAALPSVQTTAPAAPAQQQPQSR